MKLQLALDEMELQEALAFAKEVEEYVDIFEIGTPFCLRAGLEGIRVFRKAFPNKEILADYKIMDAGDYEAEMAYEAGADYCVVLGVTDLLTIKGCNDAAKRLGKMSAVDLICVEDLEKRVPALEEIGVDVLAVHTGADLQHAGRTPLGDLKEVKRLAKKSKISVAGGINSKTIAEYVEVGPDIVIVGSAICNHGNPKEEARLIKEALK